MQFKYEVRPQAARKVWSFYRHVAMKYRHTFDVEDIVRNAEKTLRSICLIEKTLQRRKPTNEQWEREGWHMANAGNWYYAYTINEDTITVQDACHAQNMKDTAL